MIQCNPGSFTPFRDKTQPVKAHIVGWAESKLGEQAQKNAFAQTEMLDSSMGYAASPRKGLKRGRGSTEDSMPVGVGVLASERLYLKVFPTEDELENVSIASGQWVRAFGRFNR